MATKERLPKVRVNFFDGQRVTESDLDTEQIYNLQRMSETTLDFHGSGVVDPSPFQDIVLLDTRNPGKYVLETGQENPSKLDVESGTYDGMGISLDRNPTDAVRGNRIELKLMDAAVRGRDKVKVILVGRAFDGVSSEGELVAEYFEFTENGSKVSQHFFREIETVLFNNFSGGTGRTENVASADSKDLISSASGYMIIKEAEPLSVYPASKMSFQTESPNHFLENFITSDTSLTIEEEFAAALGASSSVSDIYLDFDGIEQVTLAKDGDVTVAYGQKFLSKTNNIQKVDMLLSVQQDTSQPLGNEYDFAGDLVLSIYELATEVDCKTDAVPENLIDFDPEAAPIMEVSYSQEDLETLGVKLGADPQLVSFNFAGTLIADPNIDPSIAPDRFYAFLLSRRGDNRIGTIVLEKGYTVVAGKVEAGVPLTTKETYAKQDSKFFEFDPSTKRYISDSNASLWYMVHADAVEIVDGVAYTDNGVSVMVPKTESFVGESEISFFLNNLSLANISSGSNNYAVLSHIDEFVDADVHPVTNNPIFIRIQDSASVSIENQTGLTKLQEDTDPLILARITDVNLRDGQTLTGTFSKPGFIESDRITIESPGTDLLTENLINRIIVPDTECQCTAMYRIVAIECVQELAGDLDDDGELTDGDILELLNVVGNTINSESTERALLGGALNIVDFIKSDLNNDNTVDGTDIGLLEDAIDGYVNFSIPEKIRFLTLRLENVLEEDDFPNIFTDAGSSGTSAADDNQLTFTTSTESEALIVRPGDQVQILTGLDAGTYLIATKTIETDNLTLTTTVTDIDGNTITFEGDSGFNVIVTSGTAVNTLADNPTLVEIPYTTKNYEISFIDAAFEERFIDICDLRRFVESSFIEIVTDDNCGCEEDACLPENECAPQYRNQKHIPGDLYVPNGEILSAPGVPHHGDFEYVNIKVPLPPGAISNCSLDLYNTFIKAENNSCKTTDGYPAMKYSDGTYVGCEDSGTNTDLTKNRVKISSALSSLYVDGTIDGYGVDGYSEVDISSDTQEIITENFIEDEHNTFGGWTEDPGNNTVITNISHPVGVNNPAVFDLTTVADVGERYGRLNLPVASQDFTGDFIVDFTAIRTVWPEASLTNGNVSAFLTMVVENTDGTTATLKLGWRSFSGINELFYSGSIENASAVVTSTFDYSIDVPDTVGEEVLFRLRRVDDVISAYYLTPASLDDADSIAFGEYVRLGENPAVQPGSGQIGNLAYEITQNASPTAGISFFTRFKELIIRSEYTSAADSDPVILSRDLTTNEVDRSVFTFPLNINSKTVITSAVIKVTSEVAGTFGDDINVVPLDIVNADNISRFYNIPIVQNASFTTSFVPGTVSIGDVIEINVTALITSMLAAAGHLPGHVKAFMFEPDANTDEIFSISGTVELDITYEDTSTGVVFQVGTSLNPNTGVLSLNTKNILYDALVSENRTVLSFGVYLKKAGFKNSDIEIGAGDLSRIGTGICFDIESLPAEGLDDCYFIVGDTAVGSFVEGPFPCQFKYP